MRSRDYVIRSKVVQECASAHEETSCVKREKSTLSVSGGSTVIDVIGAVEDQSLDAEISGHWRAAP